MLNTADLSSFMEALRTNASLHRPTLKEVADQYSKVTADFARMDPIRGATAFAVLLTIPALQANCFRLETLVHLSLMAAKGRDKPTKILVQRAFIELGEGFCGNMEDPAEDMFVGTVRSPRGNFRVIEGIWEGNAFYLQRFINVIEAMPKGTGYDGLRKDVYALLALSDLVCERSQLKRNLIGAEFPINSLDSKIKGSIDANVRRIRFSLPELEEAGIHYLSLFPFLFKPSDREILSHQRLGATTLERHPLICERDNVYLVLPTAVSAAIRYYVIERMSAAGMLDSLINGIANEYTQHFANTQLLGGHSGAPISFQFVKHGAVASVISMVDMGRYLNFIFFTDSLTDFTQTGLAGMNPDCENIGDVIVAHISDAYNNASAQPDFVDGISLIVGCGIGRASSLLLNNSSYPNWRVEFISAYDLDTLSWTPEFGPLSLWRLFDAKEHLRILGISLQNINGLLNFVAWTRSLDGHLVPHGNIPEDFHVDENSGFVLIDQNCQRVLRHEVATMQDVRVVQDVYGCWIPVRRNQQSGFADDRELPLYCSEILNSEDGLMSVYLASNNVFWAEVSMPDAMSRQLTYERWRLVTYWLSRAAPVLSGLSALPVRPVKWRAVFEATSGILCVAVTQLTYEEARAAITVTVDVTTNTVVTRATAQFDDAIYHPENIAERALVDAFLEGILVLAEQCHHDRTDILNTIIPNTSARHAHAFAARNFRDFFHQQLDSKVVTLDKYDDASNRLGLGWSVRDRSLGNHISGKEDTISYLNALVTAVEKGICTDLHVFNRESLLKQLLLNHEAAAFDRDQWRRTSAALLAHHPDKTTTMEAIGEHEFRLNAVFQTSRILMEMAICESPLSGGREPGDLDLSMLMSKAMLLFNIGGWSDAIRWDVMEPTIRVTALGDVHAKFDDIDEIITPHAREISDVFIKDAVNNYSENLKQREGLATVSELIDQRFLDAWEDEFGFSLQDMRVFIDWLEQRGISLDQPIMSMTRNDFENVDLGTQSLESDIVIKLIDRMTLADRPCWSKVPEGFDDRDRQPWRFRRRLSPIRRPILRIGERNDERFLVAPGMVRDSFAYSFANYMRGDFPAYQLKSKMRSWASLEAYRRGAKFTQTVADALQSHGWQTETEVKLTKILARGLDRDYGDVDVLAWRADNNRVLIVECKDVQFKKTYGEVCEQLADFRGEKLPNGKRDYLLRHLDRVDVLSKNLPLVASYINLCQTQLKIESHLVFKNPVPMKYALKKLAERVVVSIYDDIPEVFKVPNRKV